MWIGTANSITRLRSPFATLFRAKGLVLLPSLLSLAGCADVPQQYQPSSKTSSNARLLSTETISIAVEHKSIQLQSDTGVDLIDVDLRRSRVRPIIATSDIAVRHGHVSGRSYLPTDWMARRGGIAVINGGYFGDSYAEGYRDFVGLLVQHGVVRHSAPPIHGQGSATIPAAIYVRSAFGTLANGDPVIGWAASGVGLTMRKTPMVYSAPLVNTTDTKSVWHVDNAVGCGPTLIRRGHIYVNDHEERLINSMNRPRTFVSYDVVNGRPSQFVMGIVSQASYREVAMFLKSYFWTAHHSKVAAAMCLDGGSSTQLSYVSRGRTVSPLDTDVDVPDSIVLVPK